MMFLHFFGFGDSLRLFELERQTGLVLQGFRPLQLDGELLQQQVLVAGLGSHGDWGRHWEHLLRV
jgi:hypothetical protein